jgi:uncharacterized repeat protein (TIGR02543 family)
MRPRKSRQWLGRRFTCFLVLLAMLFSMAGGALNPAPAYAAGGTESDPASHAVTVDSAITGGSTGAHSITKEPVPDGIWTVTLDKTEASAGETVTVTVSDTAFTSWATGLIVTGDSGATYEFTTITEATGNANNVNGPGVYSFVMPDEPVTVDFTADYTRLDVYIQYGVSGEEIPVHSYTRAEMEALAAENTEPIHYAMYDRLPAVFMGKAVRYVTIDQLANSAATYNNDVRFDGPDCSLRGASLDGWTMGLNGLSWDYLMGQPRSYYAGIGDQYLAEENRTGLDREVPAVLAITGWAGRKTQVDNQPYDTLNTYRFFYGQTEAEYGNGVLPTMAERDARCTAMNTSKFVNKIVFVVPETATQTYTVTTDSAITGGAVTVDPASAAAGETITVTVTPDSGNQLVAGSLKYTADNGASYTEITATEGVYSFVMPAADTVVTARFADPAATVTGVSLDKTTLTITVGSFEQLTAIVTPAGASNQEVTWTSNNTAVATVSGDGLVRAIGTGSANITVTTVDGGFTATCAVTVRPAGEDHFTVAVLPDTQFYSESYPEIFAQQTQWVVNHADSHNIVFVAHLGDIQDDYDNPTQWQNARDAMATIRAANIPYSLVPGNHDLNFDAGDTTNFDAYFPYTDFTGYSWYGGHYPAGSNASSYQLFSAMGQDFIVLNLVCTPALLADATDWANAVLTQYADRKAIVVTHGYIKPNGEYAGGDDVSGPAIRDNIVKKHSNVIAVLCGHIGGQYHGTDTGESGHTVYNLLTDYTNLPNGGNGWLRLYQFYPLDNTIKAVTYSPYLDQYDTSADGQFELPLAQNSCAATFVSNGMTYTTVITTPGSSIEAPADPVKSGSFFGGWYADEALTNAVTFPYTVTADVTLYAKWTPTPTTWDGVSSSTDWSGAGTAGDPYVISSAAQLKGLADSVNSGTSYGGSFFKLGDDIDLAGYAWNPIGGHCPLTASEQGVPTGFYFGGTFDGGNHSISGINISNPAAGTGAYGLFGYVNGGTIANLNVSGSLDMGDSSTSAVGAVVGYTTGSLYNLHSSMTVSVNDPTTNTASETGGIAGVVANTNSSLALYVRYCSNTGDVTGRGRMGGIVGAVYCLSDGGVVVDQCFNTGYIKSVYSTKKIFTGGIVGYCEGYITNCYNQGNMETNNGHYLAGIVGILTGAPPVYPVASMSNCYSTANFTGYAVGYDRWLWASADFNPAVHITNCFYLATNSDMTQPNTDDSWGTQTHVSPVTVAELQGTAEMTGSNRSGAFSGYVVPSYLGAADVDNPNGLYGFTYGQASSYPILAWQQIPNFIVDLNNLPAPAGYYTVSVSVSGSGGTVTAEPPTVWQDGSCVITISPAAGYSLASLTDNGIDVFSSVENNTYTINNITVNHTVVATFSNNTYTLTYTAGEHGSLSGITLQTVAAGSGGTAVTAVAENGYHFAAWSDGSIENPRTDVNVNANITVKAIFIIDDPGEMQDQDHFTIAVLPDTQFYTERYPAIFDRQTQWIADNARAQNIVFTVHLGDLVNDHGNTTQWQNARDSMSILRAAGIPYSVVPGNHDLSYATGDLTNYNIYFTYTDFSGYSWYGGHFPESSNANNYALFSAMGQDFIVLNLVCAPALLAEATEWANSVLTQYSARKAIVVTHGYIDTSGNYLNQQSVAGLDVWNNVVKHHSNVIAVLCGHFDGQYCGTDTGVNGNTVYNFLTDYQEQPNGGNGWLRLYEFYPLTNTIKAVTYSPYLDQYDTSAYGQFELPLAQNSYAATFMSGNATYTTVVAASGSSIDAPAAPFKNGFIFDGWYADEDLTNAVTFPYTITADVTLYAKWTAVPGDHPQYTVTPLVDESVYAVGASADGIPAMTVITGVAGLKYFGAQIVPVIEHTGREAVVFVHLRSGLQLSINVTRADFDLMDEAQAGFNVQAGDIVRVYIVDDLTNDLGSNPIMLQ